MSQVADTSISYERMNIDQLIENIAEEFDAELDYTTLVEGLTELAQNPINLNSATEADLQKLIVLNEIQIQNLLNHIKNFGPLASTYELQSVESFNLDVIYRILPFVSTTEIQKKQNFKAKNVFKYGKSTLFLRYQRVLEEQQGFSEIDDSTLNASPNSRYLGSPDKLYLRYNFKYSNKVSFGITAEKDAGEEFFSGNNKNGFDYYSSHLFLSNFGRVESFALGDYHLQFGQGLTLWSGLSFGKSSDAINIKKQGSGVRKYSSANENGFMRGAATTVSLGKFYFTAFYSSKKIDGNISASDTLNNEALYISSLQETGYHATPSEIENRDAVKQTLFGTNIKYSNKGLNIGATAYKTKYNVSLEKKTELYNSFSFYGKENSNIGVDYSYSFKKVSIFGEFARSENGGYAYVNGALVSLHPQLLLSILHRNYQKNYQSFYSAAFSENGSPVNEKGIYLGMSSNLSSKISISAYMDNFQFPWMKFRTDAPSNGVEYLGQINYSLSRKTNMYFRYRKEDKMQNGSSEIDAITKLVERTKESYRYHISYSVSQSITMKDRFEYMLYNVEGSEASKGYLIYHDITYNPNKPWSVSMRYALFDTDTYDSRLYAYESDVLYAFSIPAYYYKGSRFYVLLNYKITDKITFWLKYSQTYYSNKDIISSGLTQIDGNTKSEVKAQLRIKF